MSKQGWGKQALSALVVGQKATRSMTITAEQVRRYAEITGDYNPLHFDADFARRTRFGRLVAQGGITTGLLHALVAMDLPGAGSVFLSQAWKFSAPAYIGDTIVAEGEVVSVHATKPVTQMHFVIRRSDGETLLDGEAWVYTMRPQDES